MLDLIKFLVETVIKVTPSLAARKKEGDLARIGYELFCTYNNLCDRATQGEWIISKIEEIIEAGLDDSCTELRMIDLQKELKDLAMEQLAALLDLCEDMRFQLSYARIASGQAADILNSLANRKAGHVVFILSAARKGIPLEFGPRYVESEADQEDQKRSFVITLDGVVIPADMVDSREIATTTSQQLAEYLDSHDLKKDISSIRDALKEFRSALVEHFSIQDIILTAKPEHFS